MIGLARKPLVASWRPVETGLVANRAPRSGYSDNAFLRKFNTLMTE